MPRKLLGTLALLAPGTALATPPLHTPWPCDVGYSITQGHQTGSHVDEGAFAWDVGIGVGQAVSAPADGVVRRVRMDSTSGGCSSSYANDANYVVIDFQDGTEALLLHLQAGSSSLVEGQAVKQGDVVGAIGLSGWVCGAHLHFQIQTTCSSWWCQSIPASFVDFGDPGLGASLISNNCPALEPCPALDDAPIVLDDRSTCFERETSYWWSSPTGWEDQHWYTFGTPGPEDETIGRWRFDVTTGGDFLVEAFIPDEDADSIGARYFAIVDGARAPLATIDQSTQKGWRELGTATLPAGTGRAIQLGDATGEPASEMKKLAYDAIRLTPLAEPGTGGSGGAGTGAGGDAEGGAGPGGGPIGAGAGNASGGAGEGGDDGDGDTASSGCDCRSSTGAPRGGELAWGALVMAAALAWRRRAVTTRATLPALLVLTAQAALAACSDEGEADAGGAGAGAGEPTSTGTAGAGAQGGAGAGGAAEGGAAGAPPIEKPEGLQSFLVGSDADADVTPLGPAWILMGGGTDVDAAFERWVPFVAGGDVVVLRTSGADGYNDYLYTDIGGVDSVETLLVTTKTFADSDYVADRLAKAEAIFMAGGDQATYVTRWKGTRVESELEAAAARGAVIGGTSAGCAVLGEFAFSAINDTVYSDEALEDPYNQYMTMEQDFLDFPLLAGVITDTHFAERDRMGRLVSFVARPIADGWASSVVGVGVDEETALFVDASGEGTVLGNGAVYVVRSNGAPASCVEGQPLVYEDLELVELRAGDVVTLPGGASDVPATTLSASGGVTIPANPY
jgi:cyanophycinase